MRPAYRVLLIVTIALVTFVFILPIVSGPRVEPPTGLQFGNPAALLIQVSNQNLMPLTDIKYDCELSKLTSANGSEITDAKVLVHGTVRKIGARTGTTVRCESAYLVTAPPKAVEYELRIEFRSNPWPRRRTAVYEIAAQIDGEGRITGWKLK